MLISWPHRLKLYHFSHILFAFIRYSIQLEFNGTHVIINFYIFIVFKMIFTLICFIQDIVNMQSNQLARGMLGLLTYCPQEVAHLRKELLIAARHILATDLRISESKISIKMK